MAKRTERHRPDPIVSHEQYGDHIADAIHHSIRPLDEAATRLELKWGCDRLPALVSPQTAAKFGAAKARLDRAIMDNDPEEVAKRAAILIRGWEVLDAEASLSHQPLQPHIWCHTTQNGFRFAVAQANADAIKALRASSGLEGVAVYSLEEIGRILASDNLALVRTVKTSFPGAEVIRAKKKLDRMPLKYSSGGDDIPF